VDPKREAIAKQALIRMGIIPPPRSPMSVPTAPLTVPANPRTIYRIKVDVPSASDTSLELWFTMLEHRVHQIERAGKLMSAGEHAVWSWELEQHRARLR